MEKRSKEERPIEPIPDVQEPFPPQTVSSKKRTVADFLMAAEAMDPTLWEAAWENALEHLSDVVSSEEGPPVVVTAGHYAPEDSPPADESAPRTLMEVFFRDAMAAAAREGRWSEISRRTWNYGVPLIAHAWSGRLMSECVERFSAALKVFSLQGEVAVELSEGPGAGKSVVWIHSGALKLVEEACEHLTSWFHRYLADQRIPYELERIEHDDASADGRILSRHRSVHVTARVA